MWSSPFKPEKSLIRIRNQNTVKKTGWRRIYFYVTSEGWVLSSLNLPLHKQASIYLPFYRGDRRKEVDLDLLWEGGIHL